MRCTVAHGMSKTLMDRWDNSTGVLSLPGSAVQVAQAIAPRVSGSTATRMFVIAVDLACLICRSSALDRHVDIRRCCERLAKAEVKPEDVWRPKRLLSIPIMN